MSESPSHYASGVELIGKLGSETNGFELSFAGDQCALLPHEHNAQIRLEVDNVVWNGTLGNPPSGNYAKRRYLHRTLTRASDGATR